MKIYCVVWSESNSNTKVYPFTDPEKAVAEAKKVAKRYCYHEEDYEEHDYGKDSGWIFYAQYSCEGDHVRVVTTELDKEI